MSNEIYDKRRIAFLLTFVGGFLEIYSYLYMDAFATTITGNIVLLTYNLRNFSWPIVAKYFLPIFSFILGIITVEILKKRVGHISNIFWRKIILKLEIITLLLIPFIPNVLIKIMLISYISAIQIQSFKTVYGIVYMSTMSTGNVRNFFEALINKKYHNMKSYGVVITGFLLGVIFGDIGIIYLGKFSLYICIAILLICMFMLGKKR